MKLSNIFFNKLTNEGFVPALRSTKSFINSVIKDIYLVFLMIRELDTVTVRYVNGSKMKLNINPVSADRINKKLVRQGVREVETTNLLKEILYEQRERDEIYVFDVGANIGYYVLLEANILQEAGNIYAVEPEPSNIRSLEENIEINQYENIEIIPGAVGSNESTTELNIHSMSTHHWVGEVPLNDTIVDTIEVDVHPIDNLIENKNIPSDELILIRMDIQGHEDQAFDGMKKLLQSKRPIIIVVELHPREHNPRKYVINMLKKHNFKPAYASTDGVSIELDSYAEIPDGGVNLIVRRL